ncbi:MAG TPA: hypothetical protein VK994_08015 [Bacteroidales bacterium]|nr:hypothetical protein [Bacteroidales bacterium]
MKKILFLGFSILFIQSIYAQDPGFRQEWGYSKRGYIGISIGAAIPQGDFASKDLNDEYAGFAKTGLSLQLVNFGYRFGNTLGLAGMWSGAAFKMDGDAFGKSTGLGNLYSIDPGIWSSGALMAGLLISLPSSIIDVDFRVMAGPSYSQSPEIEVEGYADGHAFHFIQKSGTSYQLGLDAGIGLRFNIVSFLNINLMFDYTYARHKFHVESYRNGILIDMPEFEQPMGYFTITGGLAYRLR